MTKGMTNYLHISNQNCTKGMICAMKYTSEEVKEE